MIKTKDPQQVALALEQDKVVHHFAAGRNFRVNAIAKGNNGWFMRITHKTYHNSRLVDVEEDDEFTILTQSQYNHLLRELATERED